MKLPLPGGRALELSASITTRSSDAAFSLDQWASLFGAMSYNGVGYPFLQFQQTIPGSREEIGAGFIGYVQGAYRSNGVVFACMLARLMLFSEARFQFRRMVNGRPGDLFGTRELDILDTPWSGATTGDLLARAIQDADLAGNFFAHRRTNPKTGATEIHRLRPDWVTIVAGSESDPDVTIADPESALLGYVYMPGGPRGKGEPRFLLPEEVCHFAPVPDPLFEYRGMSWLEPVIREVMADGAATTHKLKFFENSATPNMVVSLDPAITKEVFDRWIEKFEAKHEGMMKAYKTLYLGGGAQVQVVGQNMRQMDFKVTQGAGETRIAAAANVPPIIVGLSEGLAAGTYSNYQQACRRFADLTMRPLWRNFCGSMGRIINVPGGANLWYDDRDIPFLKADLQEAVEVRQKEAAVIGQLITAGFKPDSVIDAVTSGDFDRLVHTGLYSVQLQPPGELGEPGGPTSLPALPAPAESETPPTSS